MIDYNYYTQLNDKDLEKIVSHIRNIQTLPYNEFEKHFFNADIETVSAALPDINKDKLLHTFNSYTNDFDNSQKNIDFYLFLKQNEHTKHFDFGKLEHKLCWNFHEIKNLEIIKHTFPDTFESFRNRSFQYTSEEFIRYLHKNNFIDFESIKTYNTTNEMISYMLKHNMFDSFQDFPFSRWFKTMSGDVLSQIRHHFDLPKFNLEDIFNSSSSLKEGYIKNAIRFKSPELLENFIITPFFVKEFSKTIDNIMDKYEPIKFILKMYELIKEQPAEQQPDLIMLLKSELKKTQNKEIIFKIEMNFNMNNNLPEKKVKSHSFKI